MHKVTTKVRQCLLSMLISRKQVLSSFTALTLLLYYSTTTLIYPDILTKLYCNYRTLCLWSTVRGNILDIESARAASAPTRYRRGC